MVIENLAALFQHRVKADFDEIDGGVLVLVLEGLHGMNKIDGLDQPLVPVVIREAGFKPRGDPR